MSEIDYAPSLRERRKERTWNAIHQAAATLMETKGLRGTKIDEITEMAGVSQRTFFNYFASKEDAILGFREPTVSAQMLEADSKRQNTYIFERITHLMLDMVLETIPEGKYSDYRKLAREYSVFQERSKRHIMHCETVLQDFLLTIDWKTFNAQGRKGAFTFLPEGVELSEDAAARAKAAVLIAAAVLRFMNFSAGLPDLRQRQKLISEAVKTFQYLLRDE